MNALFPEQPILFYPSLAERFGTDEAILLAIYHQFARHHGMLEAGGQQCVILRRNEWLALTPFWEEERLAATTNSLVEQGVIEAEFHSNRSLKVSLKAQPPEGESTPKTAAPPVIASTSTTGLEAESGVTESQHSTPRNSLEGTAVALPSAPRLRPSEAVASRLRRPPGRERLAGEVSEPAALTQPASVLGNLLSRGHAPAFGGSTGWQRPKDDLERLFEQQEQRNRQLNSMQAEWQPSDTALQMLAKQSIPAEFCDSCVDEFVAYWIERDRKEASWDHLFIRLVKKEWVKAQGRKAREARLSDNSMTEASGERHQADSPAQRRERITDAVMDIHNTDW